MIVKTKINSGDGLTKYLESIPPTGIKRDEFLAKIDETVEMATSMSSAIADILGKYNEKLIDLPATPAVYIGVIDVAIHSTSNKTASLLKEIKDLLDYFVKTSDMIKDVVRKRFGQLILPASISQLELTILSLVNDIGSMTLYMGTAILPMINKNTETEYSKVRKESLYTLAVDFSSLKRHYDSAIAGITTHINELDTGKININNSPSLLASFFMDLKLFFIPPQAKGFSGSPLFAWGLYRLGVDKKKMERLTRELELLKIHLIDMEIKKSSGHSENNQDFEKAKTYYLNEIDKLNSEIAALSGK